LIESGSQVADLNRTSALCTPFARAGWALTRRDTDNWRSGPWLAPFP
jgi:hypothetical protein